MTKLKLLAKTDDCVRSKIWSSDRKTCVNTFTVKENADALRANLTWTYDFSGVSEQEIQDMALSSVHIPMQEKWRKAKDRMDADLYQNRTIKVRDLVDKKRQPSDPKAKASGLLAKLPEAERKALLMAELAKLNVKK